MSFNNACRHRSWTGQTILTKSRLQRPWGAPSAQSLSTLAATLRPPLSFTLAVSLHLTSSRQLQQFKTWKHPMAELHPVIMSFQSSARTLICWLRAKCSCLKNCCYGKKLKPFYSRDQALPESCVSSSEMYQFPKCVSTAEFHYSHSKSHQSPQWAGSPDSTSGPFSVTTKQILWLSPGFSSFLSGTRFYIWHKLQRAAVVKGVHLYPSSAKITLLSFLSDISSRCSPCRAGSG